MNPFIAGFASGIGAVLIGHPWDTVKIHMQAKPTHCPTIPSTIRYIAKRDGPSGFFKGIGPPLTGSGGVSSLCFVIYDSSRKSLRSWGQSDFWSAFNAGGLVGVATTFIATPTELIKTKMQLQNSTNRIYSGNWDCFQQIRKAYGLKGLFKGFNATLVREGFGYAVYFSSYEVCHKLFGDSAFALLNAGGIAGILSWVFVYPFDVVKSRLQSTLVGKGDVLQDAYPGTLKTMRSIYVKEGWKPLWRGVSVCLLRAYPVNAITFLIYENVIQWLTKKEGPRGMQ